MTGSAAGSFFGGLSAEGDGEGSDSDLGASCIASSPHFVEHTNQHALARPELDSFEYRNCPFSGMPGNNLYVSLMIVEGDLLEQPVEVIVNSWNRNFIPYWLLWPQGVAGAIRRRAGSQPLREVSRRGLLPVGAAVLTGAGKLGFRAIIHVAGLQWWWMATERSVRLSTSNAMRVFHECGFASIAFPLIGAGTGGLSRNKVLAVMQEELQPWTDRANVRIVLFGPAPCSLHGSRT